MKIPILFFVSIICIKSVVFSQETIYDETTVVFKNQFYGGALLHTNGWGLHIQKGKNKTAFNTRIFGLEIVGMKHPKEVRSFNPYYQDPKSYIYGKLNSFFLIRPSIGYKKMLFDKIRESAVEVGYTFSVGPCLGFTKPVYFEIGHGEPSLLPYKYITVEKFNAAEHSSTNIYGKASGLKGFDELKFQPGISGKFGLYFDYSPNRPSIKGLETGVSIDAFTNKVDLLANNLNKQIYFNFYISAHFGKKYNNIN